MMDIEGLADFIALASCKSFSKAAALRHVTQPAFSRRIRTLENTLTTELVDRRSKNFKLTLAGERFLVHAVNLVDLSNRAVSDTKSLMTRLHEPVHMTAPAYLSKTFFPGWYKDMQKAVPGLAMRISHQKGSNALEDLRKGLADFALIMRAKKVEACYMLDDLSSRTIGTDKMIAVQSKHVKTVDALLMYEQGSHMNACAEFVLRKALKKDAEKSNVVFEMSSTGLLKEMVLAGFGIAVLPESVVEDDMTQGYLVPVGGLPALPCDILLVRNAALSNKRAEKLWAANQK